MNYRKFSKKFERTAILISLFLAISLIYPLFKGPQSNDTTSAGAEIRFTKGATVMHPALGQNFLAWIEYRDGPPDARLPARQGEAGAYNLYSYDFESKKEKQLNKVPLSVDTLGPVVYQDYVYWVDHPAGSWAFSVYDLNHETFKEYKVPASQVYGFNVYEKNIVYSAPSGASGAADVFILDLNAASVEPRNLTNDERQQGVPSIYGNLVAFSEFLMICQNPAGQTETVCRASETGNVMLYNLVDGYKQAIKEQARALSDVKAQYNTLAWSQLNGEQKGVNVYYLNIGKLVTVSPADFNSSDPTLSSGLISFLVKRGAGEDLDYYQFESYQRGTLGWNSSKKSQVAVSPDSRRLAWVDDRFGAADIFYYDFKAENVTADEDRDGVSDLAENQHGTNPFEPDTDRDGLTDYEEIVRYHTYATQYDSDGDGLTDGEEVKIWQTNPLAFDTDNDLYDDKTEIVNGFSPLIAAAERPVLAEAVQPLIYGQPRLFNLTIEQQMALELRQQLDQKYGRKGWSAKGAREWYKVVNAYVYGEYAAAEIARYVKGDKLALSETMLAAEWRVHRAYASAGGKVKAAMR